MVNYIPINNANTFLILWPRFIPGFQSILEHSTGDISLESIYQDILAGQTVIWEIQVNGEYAGFITVAISERVKAKKALMIHYMYLTPGTPKEVLKETDNEIRAFAKSKGCDQIQWYTTRAKAFADRLNGWGYKQSYVQFVLDIEEA